MTEIEGGWINGNFKQMVRSDARIKGQIPLTLPSAQGWQLAGALTIVACASSVQSVFHPNEGGAAP